MDGEAIPNNATKFDFHTAIQFLDCTKADVVLLMDCPYVHSSPAVVDDFIDCRYVHSSPLRNPHFLLAASDIDTPAITSDSFTATIARALRKAVAQRNWFSTATLHESLLRSFESGALKVTPVFTPSKDAGNLRGGPIFHSLREVAPNTQAGRISGHETA